MSATKTIDPRTVLRVLLSLNQPRVRASAHVEAINALKASGLLSHDFPDKDSEESNLVLSDKGEAYVDALVRLPYPELVQLWTIPAAAAAPQETK